MATKEFGMRTERADETVLRSELRRAPEGFEHVPNELTGGKDIFIMKARTVKGSSTRGGLDYRKTVKILHRNGLRLPKLYEILALAFVGDNDIPNITRIFGLVNFWVNVDKSFKSGMRGIFEFDEKGNLKKLGEEDITKISPERRINIWNYEEDHRYNYPYSLSIRSADFAWGYKNNYIRYANNSESRFRLRRGNPKATRSIMVGVPDERGKASVWSNILRRNNHE